MITGKFTLVELPASVRPGKQIQLKVNYEAENPGAIIWSTCIMAKIGIGGVETFKLFPHKELSPHAWGTTATYNLGVMPNDRIPVKLRLLAHDDAGHNWTVLDWRN